MSMYLVFNFLEAGILVPRLYRRRAQKGLGRRKWTRKGEEVPPRYLATVSSLGSSGA